MNIEETKRNIEHWEQEVQDALLNNDIDRAVMCRVLANKLREDINEEAKPQCQQHTTLD